MKSFKTFLVLLLATLIAMPQFCMAEKSKKFRYKGKSSVFVSYANSDSNPDLVDPLFINLGFDNTSGFKQFVMDTGSCGIVASPEFFTPAPDATNLGPGEVHYTDGTINKVLTGSIWTATQQIYDETGKLLATSNVPVFQVTQESINNQPPFPASKIAVMGIGFGREGGETPAKTPAFNPFLNLTSVFIKGRLRPLPKHWVNGYVITPTGVDLGLTARNTRGAGFIKLTPWPQYSTPNLPEWMPMSMTVCVNGVCGDGQSVMDTGIRNAIINPPPGAPIGTLVNCPGTTTAACFPSGDEIKVYYASQTDPVAFYTFITGQTGNPMAPSSVAVQPRPTIYWNTGRDFINGINFIYDNPHGLAGFIWNHNTPDEFGFVRPTHHNHRHKHSHSCSSK